VTLALTPDSVARLRRLLDAPPSADREPWIDAHEAAAHLGAPLSRIYDLSRKNAIPCNRDGTRLMFRRGMLDAWVTAGCPPSPPGRIAN
jgi:excisionase family DNA binding protein